MQLWVNLPAARKIDQAQVLGAAAIPELDVADARIRLVAGKLGAARGAVDGIDVAPTLLDASLGPGAAFRHDLPGGDTAFVYVLDGTVAIGPRAVAVSAGELAVLGSGTHRRDPDRRTPCEPDVRPLI